jgi:hypothetical protein
MAKQQAHIRHRQSLGGFNVLQFFRGQDTATHQASVNGDPHDTQCNHDIEDIWLQDDHDNNREQKNRKGQDDIHHPHNTIVKEASIKTGDYTQRNAHKDGEHQ